MKVFKRVLKYFVVYVVAVSLLLGLLVMTSKIPKSAIQSNLKKSVEFFENEYKEYAKKKLRVARNKLLNYPHFINA